LIRRIMQPFLGSRLPNGLCSTTVASSDVRARRFAQEAPRTLQPAVRMAERSEMSVHRRQRATPSDEPRFS
jgi:hypothetical protein